MSYESAHVLCVCRFIEGSKNIQFYRPIEGWDLWKMARRANFALFMTEGTGARCLCLEVYVTSLCLSRNVCRDAVYGNVLPLQNQTQSSLMRCKK